MTRTCRPCRQLDPVRRRILCSSLLAAVLATSASAGEQPTGCNANSLGAALIPTIGSTPVPQGQCVIPGQQIQYIASVFVSPNSPGKPDVAFCDAQGGQIAVTFPNFVDAPPLRPGQFVPTAGYPTTPVTTIGTFGNSDSPNFDVPTFLVPSIYVVDADHVDFAGFLNARVDYGQTDFLDSVGLTQQNATVLSSPVEEGTATVSNALPLCIPAISLSKTASPDRVCEGVPTEVTYTFEVSNTSSTQSAAAGLPDLANVTLSDPDCGPIDGPAGDDGDGLLNPGETWTYTCTATISTSTMNTATVSAMAIATFPAGQLVDTVEYTAQASAEVLADPLPVAVAANGGPVCQGEAVQLTASPNGAVSYAWTGPAGFMSSQQNPVVDPAVGGEYCVTVVDANGCTDTDCTTVVVEVCDGACCFPDGSCRPLSQDECRSAGGLYQGDGIGCDDVTCVELKGACCFPTGSCSVVPEDECAAAGGIYQGDGTDCAPNPCPPGQGPCCFPDGSCEVLTQAACQSAGGSFQGFGATCDDVTCVPTKGACCRPNGSCTVITEAACAAKGGDFQGTGTTCADVGCPPPGGACCLNDGSCIDVAGQAACAAAGGDYQGDGTTCAGVKCPPPPGGACCLVDGTCVDVGGPGACTAMGGGYQGDGTQCGTIECPAPPTGACCLADGSCIDALTAAQCTTAGGVYQGNGTQCGTIECPTPPTGACCLADGSCIEAATPAQCQAAGGEFQGEGVTCVDAHCAVGACCVPDTSPHFPCVETTEPRCIVLNGEFLGIGIECDDSPVLCSDFPGACCFPDGSCQQRLQDACLLNGGVFLGGGTFCSTCTDPGACCLPSGLCIVTARGSDCVAQGGQYQGDGTGCDDANCALAATAGCAAEFWMHPMHEDAWPPAYSPYTPFSHVFENAFPGLTLRDVLHLGGGSLQLAGREAVAALLNASAVGGDFGATPAEIVALFDDVYPGNVTEYLQLAAALAPSNAAGCPLNGDLPTMPLPVAEGDAPFDTFAAQTDAPGLPAECDEGSGLTLTNDVWRLYTAAASRTVMVGICESDFDTRLAIYPPGDPTMPLACADDGCGDDGLRSQVELGVQAGQQYLIRIGGHDASGAGMLRIDAACPHDVTGDGQVDVDDLVAIIVGWGACSGPCPADIDGSGAVDVDDLVQLVLAWGACM